MNKLLFLDFHLTVGIKIIGLFLNEILSPRIPLFRDLRLNGTLKNPLLFRFWYLKRFYIQSL
jgi:hypothetical protein